MVIDGVADHPDDLPQGPVPQLVLDLADQWGVAGVARPAPHPHRDPVARHGHPDHDLGQVLAGVLPAAAEPRPTARARRRLTLALGATLGVRFGVGLDDPAVLITPEQRIAVLGLEVGRGGVEEDQVDFEVEQVRDRVEHPSRELVLHLDQPVHGPVAGIVGHRSETGNVHVVGHP